VSHLEFLKLPLKSLSFDAGFNTAKENFNRILEIHRSTLEDLSISRGSYSLPFDNLPSHIVLPKLTNLTLCGPILPSFNFLSQMPSLKSLSLVYNMKPIGNSGHSAIVPAEVLYDYMSLKMFQPGLQLQRPHSLVKRTDFEQLNGVVHENLEHFSVEDEVYSGAYIKELARLMPRLKSLRVGLKNDGYEMVCRNWGNLETLDIFPYRISEQGFLGVVDGEKYAASNITDFKRKKINNRKRSLI